MSAPWGVLILGWVLSSLGTGSLVFLESIERRDSPILYWTIQATWAACGLYFIWLDLQWWLPTAGEAW